MQDHAADQLDVVMALAERSPGRFAAEGEGLRQEVVEGFVTAGPLPEGVSLLQELGVVEQLHLGLESFDVLVPFLLLAELLRLAHPQRAVYESTSRSLATQGTER